MKNKQGGRCILKLPTNASSAEHSCFWYFSDDTSETVSFPNKRGGYQRSLCSALLAHISPTLLSTSHHWELSVAADYIMTEFFFWSYSTSENEANRGERWRSGGKNTEFKKNRSPCVAMDDSRGCFCMKDCFFLPVFSLLPAAWRASGASLASSQEVKLNCRARLPNDERLWHPGML